MSEITVFQQHIAEDIDVSKTEKEILYDKFKKNNALQEFHYDSFMEIETYLESQNFSYSTIPAILLKNIVSYCTLIISEKKTDEVKFTKKIEDSYFIPIQLDMPTKCKMIINKNKEIDITIPSNVQINVLGIEIPEIFKTKFDKSEYNFLLFAKLNDLLLTGQYSELDHQSKINTLEKIQKFIPKTKKETVYFKNDKDALKILNKIIDHIIYIRKYYSDNYILLNNYIHNEPFVKLIKKIKNTQIFPDMLKQKRSSDKVLELIEDISNYKLHNNNISNMMMLNYTGLYENYNKIKLSGINGRKGKKIIQDMNESTVNKKIIDSYLKEKSKKELELAKKKSIAFDKFNIKNLNKLNENQLKIIKIEYEKLEKYYESLEKYKDEYEIISKLSNAINFDDFEVISKCLKDVEKIIKVPKNIIDVKDFLYNKKNVPLICPHIIFKAQKLIKVGKNITQSGQIRQSLLDLYSMPVSDTGYYCKICGEFLAEVDDKELASFLRGFRPSDSDELTNRIWKDTTYIMSGYVKFKDSVNVKSIVKVITNSLRNELGSIEIDLIKIKSNTVDDIKNIMSIYIAIYVFAIVTNMIVSNYGKMTFSIRPEKYKKINKKSGGYKSPIMNYKSGGKSDPKIIQNIMNNAIFIILKIKNTEINNSSLTRDIVKSLFIKAYKWVLTLESTKLDKNNVKKDKDGEMYEKDTLFKYLQYANLMSDIKKEKYNPKAISVNYIKKILNRTPEEIEEGYKNKINKYETAVIPTWTNDQYKQKSFESVIEYVADGLYNKTAVPYSASLSAYDKKYEPILKMEKEINREYVLNNLRPFSKMKLYGDLQTEMNDFSPSNINIAKYYDNKGRPRKFDIYVFQHYTNGKFKGVKKEYKDSDIKKLVSSNDEKKIKELNTMFVVDERCSISGELYSQVKNKGIEKVLEKKEIIEVFFKYYENKCPKGELHNFKIDKSKTFCVKCGLSKEEYEKMDNKYYEKYKTKYEKSISLEKELEKNTLSFLYHKKQLIKQKTFPKWKINNSTILQFSRLFNIKYNILINLGLSTNINFSSIEKGTITPSNNVDKDEMVVRNLILYGYYLYILRLYYTIKNYTIVSILPYDLNNIMKKRTVKDFTKLSDVTTIKEKYDYYLENETPENISNFLLYSIFELLLSCSSEFKKIKLNIGDDLVKYAINNILSSEKLKSKPNIDTLVSFSKKNIAETDDDPDAIIFSSDDEDDDVEPDDFATGEIDVDNDIDDNMTYHGDF